MLIPTTILIVESCLRI